MEDEILTPALKALLAAQNKTNHDFKDIRVSRAFVENNLSMMIETISEESLKISCAEHTECALKTLDDIHRLFPDAGMFADLVAYCCVAFSLNMMIDKTQLDHRSQTLKIKPLVIKSQRKADTTFRARTVAIELWHADTAQKIRISDMADRVYRTLAAEGFTDSLPDTAERVKEWIKPVAPDYARKGGKPRKTP